MDKTENAAAAEAAAAKQGSKDQRLSGGDVRLNERSSTISSNSCLSRASNLVEVDRPSSGKATSAHSDQQVLLACQPWRTGALV